jgi:hypothetical protein
MHLVQGAEPRDALFNEDLQVLRCGERRAGHEVDDLLIAHWGVRMESVAVQSLDSNGWMDSEGGRVGPSLAATEVRYPQCFRTRLNIRGGVEASFS